MLKTNSIDKEGFTQSKHQTVAFPNLETSDSLESLVPIPKPHEFPHKNLGSSPPTLENWNHLIPSADETTVMLIIFLTF